MIQGQPALVCLHYPESVCLVLTVLTHLLSVAPLVVIIMTTTLGLIILTLPPNSTCFHRPKDVISEVSDPPMRAQYRHYLTNQKRALSLLADRMC